MKALVTRFSFELESMIADQVNFRIIDSSVFNKLNIVFDENMHILDQNFVENLNEILNDAKQKILDGNTEREIESKVNALIDSYRDKNMLVLENDLVPISVLKDSIVLNKYEYFDELKKYVLEERNLSTR